MRRSLLAILAALLLVTALPAQAITYGEPDGTAHSHVGLVVFYDATGRPTHRCSGTLLSPTVFLTAGHCTDGTARAQVWFDPVVTREQGFPFTGGVTGTPHTHPSFRFVLPNTSDVGIVVLDKRVKTATYGALPELGFLDVLATKRGQQEVNFTVVGYGLQEIVPDFSALRERFRGTVQLVELTSALTDGFNIHFTSDPGNGTGSGGLCFGDSGGPAFAGDSNVVVGISSFVLNLNCKGAAFSYRTDIANAQDFIRRFLR